MTLDQDVGYCLVDREIKELLRNGNIISTSDAESRAEASTFDTIIGDEVFILDDEIGLFTPSEHKSVYRKLLELPARRRKRVNIANGFELKSGFSYLLRLEDRLVLSGCDYVKSSAKSSRGRLFLDLRLYADYNANIDEVNAGNLVNGGVDLWLLVQPSIFNVIVHPGLALNQLKFFPRYAQLSPTEIRKEMETHPLLLRKNDDGEVLPAKSVVTDELKIHLNLSGRFTEGVVGLRARKNPEPLDLGGDVEYDVEDYFEPIMVGKENPGLTISPNEHYLLSTHEILDVPNHLSGEMRAHSHTSWRGPLHFAGFIGNGFHGDLVLEVKPQEISRMRLYDGMPVSTIALFRSEVPDEPYNKSSQNQVGPKPLKPFRGANFIVLAKEYQRRNDHVLVQDANLLNSLREIESGFEWLPPEKEADLQALLDDGFYHYRYDCDCDDDPEGDREGDELVLQVVPYVVLFGPDDTIFCYTRADDIDDSGEVKLHGKQSVGVGGHILEEDAPDHIANGVQRKVFGNEVKVIGDYSEPKLVGTMMAYDKPVDRVHFGLVMACEVYGNVEPVGKSIAFGDLIPIDQVNTTNYDNMETWSRVLLPYLREIRERL